MRPEFYHPQWKTVVLWDRMAALSNEEPQEGLWEEIFRKLDNIQEETFFNR